MCRLRVLRAIRARVGASQSLRPATPHTLFVASTLPSSTRGLRCSRAQFSALPEETPRETAQHNTPSSDAEHDAALRQAAASLRAALSILEKLSRHQSSVINQQADRAAAADAAEAAALAEDVAQQTADAADQRRNKMTRIVAWTGLGLLLTQWTTFFYLTYYVLSWCVTDILPCCLGSSSEKMCVLLLSRDTVEPVAFLTTQAYGVCAYAWWLVHGREFSNSHLAERVAKAARVAARRKAGA